MLYVFHVNSGRIMEFDIGMLNDTVFALKLTIEATCSIPADKQVLLISGGEILRSDARVYIYSAGTDTNPIFLISTGEQQHLQVAKLGEQRNFCDVIRAALSLPAAYSTVVARAKLAQQLYEAGSEQTRMCERIVFEQHMQQQGWLAVVANMEDTTLLFKMRFHDFYAYLDANLPRMGQYQQRLDALAEDLRTLDRITISPALMQAAVHYDFAGFGSQLMLEGSGGATAATAAAADPSTIEELDEEEEDEEKETTVAPTAAVEAESNTTDEPLTASTALVHYQSDAAAAAAAAATGQQLTLLQWLRLGSKNSESLERIAEQCSKNIARFNEKAMGALRSEVEVVQQHAQQESIRDLRNVGPRFQALDKLMCDAKRLVKEQHEIAAAIQKHEVQVSSLGDASVLPDLCESHANQLEVMLRNHTELCDFLRRTHKSKEELCDSMLARIKYMSTMENRMHSLDTTMMFYNQCLRRLHRHLEVVEQIRVAPSLYVLAIEEVVRRRTFAAGFARWCAELVGDWSLVYAEEVGRRQEFRERFGGHFLSALFTGLEDMPPPFAIEEPERFDANLPNVTQNDLIVLSKFMPVTMPDMSAVIAFFAGRSNNVTTTTTATCASCAKCTKSTGSGDAEFERPEPEREQPMEARPTTAHPKPTDMLYHLKDGCDSETDTEEFEKLDKLATPATSTTGATTCATCSAAAAAATSAAAPLNRSASTSMPELIPHSISTSTADDGATAAAEAELQRLRQLLRDMRTLCTTQLAAMRTQLSQLANLSATDRATVQQQFAEISNSWRKLETDRQVAHRDQLAEQQTTHQRAMRSLQEQLNAAQAECAKLRSDAVDAAMVSTNRAAEAAEQRAELQAVIGDLNTRLAVQAGQLAAADAQRERAVREAHETMQRQHKTEVESLRSRFKLMANMERSPSDSSLEKIDRAECLQQQQHSAVLQATATDFAAATGAPGGVEVVVQQQPRAAGVGAGGGATPKLGSIPPGLAQSPGKSSVDVFRQILFAKEQELEQMRAEQQQLCGQNRSLRDAIQVLTASSATTAVEERTVRDELAELKRELSVERTKRVEMERSFVRAEPNSVHIEEEGLNSTIRKLKKQLELQSLQTEIRLLELGNTSFKSDTESAPTASPVRLSDDRSENRLRNVFGDTKSGSRRKVSKSLFQCEDRNEQNSNSRQIMGVINEPKFELSPKIDNYRCSPNRNVVVSDNLPHQRHSTPKCKRTNPPNLYLNEIEDGEIKQKVMEANNESKFELVSSLRESLNSPNEVLSRNSYQRNLCSNETKNRSPVGESEKQRKFEIFCKLQQQRERIRHANPPTDTQGLEEAIPRTDNEDHRTKPITSGTRLNRLQNRYQRKTTPDGTQPSSPKPSPVTSLIATRTTTSTTTLSTSAVAATATTAAASAVKTRSSSSSVAGAKSTVSVSTTTTTTAIVSAAGTTTVTGTPGRSRASCTRRMVCVDGCTKGDNVLVMWDPRHHQYVLLQDNPVNYFLHADSYAALGLKPPPAQSNVADLLQSSCIVAAMSASSAPPSSVSPPPSLPSLSGPVAAMAQSSAATADSASSSSGGLTPAAAAARLSACLWQDAAMRQTPAAIGKLLDKEFCYARKDMNRYRVERGSRFYRAKVGPTSPNRCTDPLGKCCAKRMRQDSDNPVSSLTVTVPTITPSAAAAIASVSATESAAATPRQNSFISSFSQTDSSDLLLPDDKTELHVIVATSKPAKSSKASKSARAAATKPIATTTTATTMTATTMATEAEPERPEGTASSVIEVMVAPEEERQTPASAIVVTPASGDMVDAIAPCEATERTQSPEETDQRVPEQLQSAASDDDDARCSAVDEGAAAAEADQRLSVSTGIIDPTPLAEAEDLSSEATLVAEVEAAVEAVAVSESVAMSEAEAAAAETVEDANILVTEEDCGNLSDGSSLYQTFDEVFELDAAKMSAPFNSQPRPVSSASSETAPVPDSGN